MITDSFSFEHRADVSPADYLEELEQRSRLPRSYKGRAYLIGFTLLGLAALFSIRTAAIGGIILFLCAFAWSFPLWTSWGARRSLKDYPYLLGPVVYGISDANLWYRGGHLVAESSWLGLSTWEEKDGVLILRAHGLPSLRYPIAELSEAGVYDRIRLLMTRHGAEFDSPQARAAI